MLRRIKNSCSERVFHFSSFAFEVSFTDSEHENSFASYGFILNYFRSLLTCDAALAEH